MAKFVLNIEQMNNQILNIIWEIILKYLIHNNCMKKIKLRK